MLIAMTRSLTHAPEYADPIGSLKAKRASMSAFDIELPLSASCTYHCLRGAIALADGCGRQTCSPQCSCRADTDRWTCLTTRIESTLSARSVPPVFGQPFHKQRPFYTPSTGHRPSSILRRSECNSMNPGRTSMALQSQNSTARTSVVPFSERIHPRCMIRTLAYLQGFRKARNAHVTVGGAQRRAVNGNGMH